MHDPPRSPPSPLPHGDSTRTSTETLPVDDQLPDYTLSSQLPGYDHVPSGLPWEEFRERMLSNFDATLWTWLWIVEIDRKHVDRILGPLHWAAAAGDLAALQVLCVRANRKQKAKQQLSRKADRDLCLHVAAAFGRVDAVSLLLERHWDLEAEDIKERTALYIAVSQDQLDVVRVLLAAGASPNASPKYQPTVLDLAILNNNEDLVELLLEQGASVDVFDSSGNYPLHIAAKRGSPRIADLLLDHGADIEGLQKGYKLTPLHCAASQLNLLVARKLIARGAQVNAVGGWESKTPLHNAASAKTDDELAADLKVEIVQLLINSGADVNAEDKSARTPLHYAVGISPGTGQDEASLDAVIEAVEVLLDHGANIHAEAAASSGSTTTKRTRWTPLHEAALTSSSEVVTTLVSRGANVNEQDGQGHTPLDIAISRFDLRQQRDITDFRRRARRDAEERNQSVARDVVKTIQDLGGHVHAKSSSDVSRKF